MCPLLCKTIAFARIGTGTAAVLYVNLLDLPKDKFRVSTRVPEGPLDPASSGPSAISMRARDGPGYTVASARTSWAIRAVGDFIFSCAFFSSRPSLCFAKVFLARHEDLQLQPTNSSAVRLSKLLTSPSVYSFSCLALLLYFVSTVTAILTNPIWVVKVQTFTRPSNSPDSCTLKIGLVAIWPCSQNQPLAQEGMTGSNPATVPMPCAS